MIKTAKGTIDYKNKKLEKLDHVISIIEEIFEKFQGEKLITPVFERQDVLTNKYGEEEKLIYNIENKPKSDISIEAEINEQNVQNKCDEQEKLSLRYDMTVPLVRHVIMNKIDKMKRYTIGKVYRKETTSKKIKRLREFHQADFDYVGKYDTNLSEIKIFLMTNLIFKKLKIENYKIKFNFRQLLYEYVVNIAGIDISNFSSVCSSIDKLDKKTWTQIETELIEKGITLEQVNKVQECINSKQIPLNSDMENIYSDLISKISEYGITNIEFDTSLARGPTICLKTNTRLVEA